MPIEDLLGNPDDFAVCVATSEFALGTRHVAQGVGGVEDHAQRASFDPAKQFKSGRRAQLGTGFRTGTVADGMERWLGT
jgi:hypothetical protein